MTKKATAFISIVGALIVGWAGSARADQPVTFEPGTGKYILVLEDPRTEVEDPVTGKKKAREPDVQKHGGTVLHEKDATRVIKLPTRAAVALRKEENVAYLQRIWLGESREEWGEEAQQSSLKTAVPETLDTDLTWTTGTYLYDGSGNIKQIGTDTYRYDTLGRLAQAVVKGITETYQYDSFGNLVGKTVNGQPRPIAVDSSSNRLQGEAYDAAGNVTTQAGQPRYHYDSFSMVDRWERPPSNRKRYIYGPDDERIGTVLQEGSFSRWKIRDFSGKVLREFKADDTQGYWEWIEDYAYADGRLLAAERESYYGGKRHFHTDHLGSVRMITDQTRKRIAVHDFSAFGVEQTDAAQEYNRYAGAGGGGDFRAEPMKFTGHERDQHGWLNVDNDDSLDYMHARYYDPNLGRFLSVDPTWASADISRPQSWNRYAYVENNPINKTDPDGRCPTCLITGELPNERLGFAFRFAKDYLIPDGDGPLFEAGMSLDAATPDLQAAAAGGAIVTAYEVGTVDKLRANSVPGDKLDIHHAPQARPAGQVIANYDPAKAPGIALPAQEHQAIPTQKGTHTGSPRDLVAKDIRDLRKNTHAPPSALRKLVKLIKETFDDVAKKAF